MKMTPFWFQLVPSDNQTLVLGRKEASRPRLAPLVRSGGILAVVMMIVKKKNGF